MQDLLYLVHRIPYPPNKGDKVRSFNMLRFLAQRYRVHLGAFVDDPEDWRYVDDLKQFCGEVHLEPLSRRRATLKSATGLLSGEALTLPFYRHNHMQQWVDRVLRRHPIQRVLVFSSPMAQYVAKHTHLTRIADFVDIDSDKWRQYAQSKQWPLSWVYRREADRLFTFEQQVTQQFDGTVFVSSIEAQHFRDMAPACKAKVGYVNNGVDAEYFNGDRAYDNPYGADEIPLVFTGAMDYWPNIDAVQWFASEILPGLRQRIPALVFYIVGARPTEAVLALAQQVGIKVTGSVPDIRPYIAHARLAVAPLRIARGVQNKVLEAMAMAKLVIASPQAAEGIEATRGEDLLVADQAPDYQHLIERALAGEFATVPQAARQCVERHYDWFTNLAHFAELLDRSPGTSVLPNAVIPAMSHSGRGG
ncbi:sugar transferase (PEP-CTERM/EpsH1 system associated) [Chitinivorax tropicus]|uniref:Sugar transferase (PEP-CTERM/EpsH1 system associated) n=1 Tax=Chitinivorax tropicus TaxID=714531 RepID=A0A840MQ48_9PROT|nr:TIGR03087 family PEP-CTERM/XrtA system glycosyltransferase [Chitinivorax tropicus]MBB5018882.1 sugar transferase (PEP-CTERM/EpsH1 system associated) [Chitinivorax tropicus]